MATLWFSPSDGDNAKAPDWCVPVPAPSAQGSPFVRPRNEPSLSPPPAVEPEPQPEISVEPPPPPTPPEEDPEVIRLRGLLAQSIQSIIAKRDSVEEKITELSVAIGLKVAEELTCGALEADPTKIAAIVREAISMMDEEGITVRLHPDILSLMESTGALEGFGEEEKIKLVPEEKVGPHGCIVESSARRVDADLDTRLRRLRQLFAQTEGGSE